MEEISSILNLRIDKIHLESIMIICNDNKMKDLNDPMIIANRVGDMLTKQSSQKTFFGIAEDDEIVVEFMKDGYHAIISIDADGTLGYAILQRDKGRYIGATLEELRNYLKEFVQ